MQCAGIPVATLTLFACGRDSAGAESSAAAWCRMAVLPRISVRWIAAVIAQTAARSARVGLGPPSGNPRMCLSANIDLRALPASP